MMNSRIVEKLENGAVLYQVTDEPSLKDNIYCERSYCSPDSQWFVYRRAIGSDGRNPWGLAEYVACEFGSWKTRVLGQGLNYPEISRKGHLFHERVGRDGIRQLFRINIVTGRSEEIAVAGGTRACNGMTISPDEQWLAYGVPLGFDPQRFGVELVDLRTGRKRVIFEDPYICNPHTQFDQCDGEHIMVQQNRGCQFAPDGRMITALGPEGCTLFLVRAADGVKTELAVGSPHTPGCSGHEQWIGAGKEIIFTVTSGSWGRGRLLAVGANQAARQVTDREGFNHIHASVCGRFFCSDRTPSGEIVVGSIQTGKWAVVCHAAVLTKVQYDEYGQTCHAHPYLSPDLRWVVFNSCRPGGRPEIHVASVPPELIESLTAVPAG